MAAKKAAKANANKLKWLTCPFCRFAIPIFHHHPQSRKPVSGFDTLKRHIEVDHKTKYLEMKASFDQSTRQLLPNDLRK